MSSGKINNARKAEQRKSLGWRTEYVKATPIWLLAERARRQAIELSLTAQIMGDPPPTRSALGRELQANE